MKTGINNSINRRSNYLTLNRGRIHGIKPQMAVIGPAGVVGIVLHVSNHFCTVLSLLNSQIKLSAKIRENNYFGSLTWDGKDPIYATLGEINKHVKIEVGQHVVTSAYSTIFPENINIGLVEEVGFDEGKGWLP